MPVTLVSTTNGFVEILVKKYLAETAASVGEESSTGRPLILPIELVDTLGGGKVSLHDLDGASVAAQLFGGALDLRLIGCDDQIKIILVEAPVTTASLRWVSDMGRLLHTGLEYDLDAAVLLVAESLVKFRPFFERRGVSDDEGRIDVAILDALQKLRQVVLDRRLRHPERQSPIDGRTHRNLSRKPP